MDHNHNTKYYSDLRILDRIDKYKKLEGIVEERLKKAISYNERTLIHVSHRIKTTKSIKEKLRDRHDEFPDLASLYDLLGFRVICYFQEDIDEIAELIAGSFRVDWDRSKDRRKLIDPTPFGYTSLHYICALPGDAGYPEALCNLWFEVQIRTILMHSWAEIEHDLGYKTEFGVPRAIRRKFSQVSGLLETADDIFSDIRKEMAEYKAQVRENISNDCADDMELDGVTLSEFTSSSKIYQSLLSDIAAITSANITYANPENQLKLLDFLGVHTLGDLVEMIRKNRDLTLELATIRLSGSELEELTTTAPFYYLYRARLIRSDLSREKIKEFFSLMTEDPITINRTTNWIESERFAREGVK